MQEASLKQQERASGQGSLFGSLGAATDARPQIARRSLPNVAPMSEHERLTREKEILGFYISGHPLEPFRAECELFATHTVARARRVDATSRSRSRVVVTAIKKQVSKKCGRRVRAA